MQKQNQVKNKKPVGKLYPKIEPTILKKEDQVGVSSILTKELISTEKPEKFNQKKIEIQTPNLKISTNSTKSTTATNDTKESIPKFVTINDEQFLNEYPKKHEINENMQLGKTIDIGLAPQNYLSFFNNRCPICNADKFDSISIIRFSCGHWAHVICIISKQKTLNQHTTCISCNSNTLDTGNDPNRSLKLLIETGYKLGAYDPTEGLNIMLKKMETNTNIRDKIFKPLDDRLINSRLFFNGDLKNFMVSNITLQNFLEKKKTILDVIKSTGCFSLIDLEKKGLNYTFFTKAFMCNSDIMLELGINRLYIMSKIKMWPLPKIELSIPDREKNMYQKFCPIHPVEFMLRRGFTGSDFVKLGWTNKHFLLQDDVSNLVCNRIFLE